MKSYLDKSGREELIARIHSLNDSRTSEWGKMNVYQMIRHCMAWEEMILGNKPYERVFMGRIFGKMALRSILRDEKPLRRNTPTIPAFIIKETSGDTSKEKMKWVELIGQYDHFQKDDFVHPFFGKMTREQIGYMAYKHSDHHLRQFGV